MKNVMRLIATSALIAGVHTSHAGVIVGNDASSANSEASELSALLSANRGRNGGGDQSMQFGDHITGTDEDDLLIGGLGIDVLFAKNGNDVIIGGTEDFNPANRDRAFGEDGDDVFIWAPGDGNDFFDGGEGNDVLIMALIGEETATGVRFSVSPPGTDGSQDFDDIFILNELPVVNPNGPGFCEVLDSANPDLEALGLDHIVRFILRGPANAFDEAIAIDPNIDTTSLDSGLRIAVHLANTEFLVCNNRNGTETLAFDLRQSPIAPIPLADLPAKALQVMNNGISE